MSIQMLAFGIVQYLSNDKYKLWSENCYRIERTVVFSYVVLSPGGWIMPNCINCATCNDFHHGLAVLGVYS